MSWKKLGMGLAVAAVGLVLLNGAVMAWEYWQNGTVRLGGKPVGVYDAEGRLIPGTEINGAGHRFRVNGAGLRGGELSAEKGPRTVRIWCAGGSTTFDTGVSDDAHTWPAQLQATLADAHPDLQIEVINAGLPGEVMRVNTRDFRQLAPIYRPDVLVVYHGPNDIGYAASAKYGMGAQPNFSSDIAIYRLLVESLPPPAPPAEWADHRVELADLAGLRRDTLTLIQEARAAGAAVVLSSHALAAAADATGWDARRRVGREARPGMLTAEAFIASIELGNQLFSTLAREEGLPFADIRAAVTPTSANFVDAMHFSDRGALQAARAFAATLEAARLVTPRVTGATGARAPSPGTPDTPPSTPPAVPPAPPGRQGPPLPPGPR